MDQLSVGSVISLRSVTSGVEEGNRRGRRNSTGSAKRLKKPASPYGTPSKPAPKKQTKRTGREIWVEAVQNGGGLSSESKPTNTWRHGKPPHLSNASTATPFLREQLLAGSGSPLPNKVSRPASATARVGGTGPIYKDAESYYDEIQVLKRQLKQLKHENDEAKAKNVRMSDEIIAKSRKIEELLNPELQSNDMRRTLTSKKPNASEVVMSLRRKIYKLEENLRDKEAAVKKMKRDMKQTDMEEMNLENQMYLYEIGRLTQIVKDIQLKNTQNTISDEAITEAMRDTDGRKTQILLKRLTEDNQGLVLQNKSLKNDLMKLSKGNESGVSLNKDYEDMNRNELLQKVLALEQRLKVEEKKTSVDIVDAEVDSENIDDRCIRLQGPLPQQIKQLRSREKELLSEVESLENTVKKLKEDRSHYRKQNDEYRLQLDNLKKKVDEVQSDTASIKSEKSPKHKKTISKKNSDKVPKIKEIKEEKVSEAKIQELQEANAAKKIQRGWRKHQNDEKTKKVKEEEEFEDAIINIQSSWRAHKARESYLTSARDEYEAGNETDELGDDDILLIQSALRGHSSRQQLLKKEKARRSSVSQKSSVSNYQDNSQSLPPDDGITDESDDDDDVVIGSSASLLQYRPTDSRPQSSLRSPATNSMSRLSNSSRSNYFDNSYYDDAPERSVTASRNSQKLRAERQNSAKSLKSASSPRRVYNEIESDEEDEIEVRPRSRMTPKKEPIREEKRRKNSTRDQRSSGGNKSSGDESSKRLSMRKSQQLLKEFQDEDEDDDLVVGASFQKKLNSLSNKNKSIDDGLF